MKRKLLSVAVAGALAAPAIAFAQASTVQLYGKVVINYNYVDNRGNRLAYDQWNSHDANIGFRGEEKLGGGMSAWFQCESTLNATGSSGGDNGFCGRNSALGFKGAFGNIFGGVWDTPVKTVIAPSRPFSTSGGYGMGDVMFGGVQSDVGNTGASFTRRQINTWNYRTPNLSGFQVMAQFSSPNEATGQTNTTTASKPRLWGLGASYANGPLYVAGGYEKHRNFNPAGVGSYTGGDDRYWALTAMYTFAGKFKVSAIYTDMKYETSPGTELKHKAWGIFGNFHLGGPHSIQAEYVNANDNKGNFVGTVGPMIGNAGLGGTGAKLWGIRYGYDFSKRTQINFGYARIDNDSNANFVVRSLGRPPSTTGNDSSAFVLGLVHSF